MLNKVQAESDLNGFSEFQQETVCIPVIDCYELRPIPRAISDAVIEIKTRSTSSILISIWIDRGTGISRFLAL